MMPMSMCRKVENHDPCSREKVGRSSCRTATGWKILPARARNSDQTFQILRFRGGAVAGPGFQVRRTLRPGIRLACLTEYEPFGRGILTMLRL
jgi:hypothetical protein